jgi:hopanoid C-3 methylase
VSDPRKLLLLRPVAPNERFGLGPFFRIEPLGLEYIAAAARRDGHAVSIYDLRFVARGLRREQPLERILAKERPDVVGVASAHTLDTHEALDVARRVKRWSREIFTLVGGHAAAVFPEPFLVEGVDGVCCEDGERVVPDLLGALASGRALSGVAGLIAREGGPAGGAFLAGPRSATRVGLDEVPLPARDALVTGHGRYLCVQRRPVYLVETTRGCPFRCSFCTIWQHVDRTFRCRGIGSVVEDLASVGGNVFFADDLFGHPADHSAELAASLSRRGVRKDWLLAQTRTDLVARHPGLLQRWRRLANHLDVFFGFESPTDAGLESVRKDQGVAEAEEAIAVCRRLGVGVTGNFICDPDWDESDFERLWAFLAKHRLDHVGFTVLTPLPGTRDFDDARLRIRDSDWSHYDMHHVLWEPRLGRRRFFELFAETWRRTALNPPGARALLSYVKQVTPRNLPSLLRVLRQSRRLFDPDAYLAETFSPGPTLPLPEHALARVARAER